MTINTKNLTVEQEGKKILQDRPPGKYFIG